jgi:hypothetical protein
MTCHELEALRLALLNILGTADRSVREHAESELPDDLSGPVEALQNAEDLDSISRHLDAALVDLEQEVAETPPDDPEYDYLRGRLVAVRNAERAVQRLVGQAEGILDGLGEAHHHLHELFPADE